MNKDELQKNILERIGSDSKESFLEFLKRTAEYLYGKKTLKLNGIGTFQLKKEPLSRMERRGEENEKNIIVFLPEGETAEESLLSFEVINDDVLSDEFSDSVFDIGVDKPTIISNSENFNEDVDSKILTLIESGSVLENYDILSSELSSTEEFSSEVENTEFNTKEIMDSDIDEANQIGDITETHINENFLNNVEEEEKVEEQNEVSEYEDNFNASNEEDISEEIIKTDFEEVSSNLETKITEEDVLESESEIIEQTETIDSVSSEDIAEENVVELDDINEELDEDKNPFDELDDYIKDETKDEAQEIIDEAPDEVEEEIVHSEQIETEPKEPEEENRTERKSYSALRNKSSEWYKKPILLISILVAVIAFAVIFLFWPSTEEGVAENSVANSEIISSENNEHTKIDSTNIINKEKTENVEEKKQEKTDAEKLAEVKKIEKQNRETVTTKGTKKVIPKVGKKNSSNKSGKLYRDIPNDVNVASRIYTDGVRFTVQSSSWRSTSIAEREVSKLKKRGFDAFIVKVFIKSKGSTWNRVRIGYFNTQKEAEEFLQKNRI